MMMRAPVAGRVEVVLLFLVAAAVLPYAPFLKIPFISDDYIQIDLARQYGSPSNWSALAEDALYRCRATSLVATYLIDSWFGLTPLAHNAFSLLMHILNTLLVAATGFWPRIGFALSIPAAFFFAVHEGHQEAVVWTAALPELLVFFFSGACVLLWALWLERECRPGWIGISITSSFVLALLSKESAVAILPVLAAIWWLDGHRRDGPLVFLAGLTILCTVYTVGVFQSANHLHLRDGTFEWRSPFWLTAGHSLLRILWIWGVLALLALWRARSREGWKVAAAAIVWMAITLAPYSFLSYMSRVPSRHTYLASAGLAILAAAAWKFLPLPRNKNFISVLLVALVAFHNIGYLWVKKVPQFERRVLPTHRFLDFAGSHEGPIVIRCAPYSVDVMRSAARLVLARDGSSVIDPKQPIDSSQTVADYCDAEQP